MQKSIACLLLVVLLGMMPLLLFAQQNQNTEKLEQEIEALEKRVSELEKQLQSVEIIEKMDLQAKLAEANAQLINAGVDKYRLELRDSNNEWLRKWGMTFLAFLAAGGIGIVLWLKSRTNQLIADEVEKNLNGFKAAVDEQNIIKSELRVLKKEHAASVLMDFHQLYLKEEHKHSERIKSLSDEDILQVFEDDRYGIQRKYQAAAVLVARKSPRIISPMLVFLNSAADTDSNIDYFGTKPHDGITLLAQLHTPEVYQGLTKFLNRLLTENPKHKDLFLKETVFSLADVSVKLNIEASAPIVKRAIPQLKDLNRADLVALRDLARYFDIFNEPEGIKAILINHLEDDMPHMDSLPTDVENECLDLLEEHDPQYVADQRASKTADNNQV